MNHARSASVILSLSNSLVVDQIELKMIRSILIASLFIVSTTLIRAADDAEWVDTDNAISSTTKIYRGTRKTTTSEAEFIPRTSRRSTTLFSFGTSSTSTFRPAFVYSKTSPRAGDSEWVDTDNAIPSTTGTRKTTTSETEFIPRTSRRSTTRFSFGAHSTSTFRPSASSKTSLIDTISTVLRNFTKLTTDHPTSEDCGKDCLTTIMRLEIFTMATGNHFVLSPFVEEKTEQKQRKRAGAIGNLWLDLFCTEDIDTIMTNITQETLAHYSFEGKSLTKDILFEMFKTLFDKLENAIEEDTFLSTMYTAEQIRFAIRFFDPSAEVKVYFPFDDLKQGQGDVDEEKLTQWLSNTNIRKFFIHKQFLEMKDGDSSDEMTVRSIINVARERCCIDPMQKIYNNALDECAENFDVSEYPQKVIRTFIDKLTRAIEADKKVNEEWIRQKEGAGEKSRVTKYNNRRT